MSPVTLRDLRRATRSVRSAELGRPAERTVRVRTVGPTRSRPPLPLLLGLAAVRGLLVWSSPAEFVLLDPPGGWRPASMRARAAGVVDRQWEVLVLLSVPAVGLTAGVLAALGGAPPLPVLLLVLVALGWVAGCLTIGVLRQGRSLGRALGPGGPGPAELTRSALYPHWQLALVHAPAGRVAPVVERAVGRARALAGADPRRDRRPAAGVQCADAAGTTPAARAEIRSLDLSRAPRPVAVSVLRRPDRHTDPFVGPAGIGTILFGVAVALGVLPLFVSGYERAGCAGTGCADRPTTYWSALNWLLGRLLPGSYDGGPRATSVQATVLGWLMVPLGLVVLACVGIAVRRGAEVARRRQARASRQLGTASSRIFLNYRGDDTGGWVVAIDNYLTEIFGPIYRDSRSILAGTDFRDALVEAVRAASVLLAVIGPGWLAPDAEGRRRVDDPADWVRRELEIALGNGVPIIPVLVDGAERLTDADLPGSLAGLRPLQYVELRHRNDQHDLVKLAEKLERAVPDLERVARD